MDEAEARLLLDGIAAEVARLSYDELVARYRGETECREVVGESGAVYQVEVQAFWDGRDPGPLRVILGVDDGGWRAWSPLTTDFVMLPDGTLL